MQRTIATGGARLARLLMFCADRVHPADPEFLRVTALNAALALLGGAGLLFALFNSLVIGTAGVVPLVVFDLCAFAAACGIGAYLWRTHDVERGARMTDLACFAAFLVLVVLREGGEYFVLWTMLYPPLAFMLGGLRRGLVHSLLFLAILFVLAVGHIGAWNHGHLNAIAASNLVGATLALTGLVMLYERARRNAQLHGETQRHELEYRSIRDGLTGLYNRRYFDEILPRELARRTREHRHLVLIQLDVDHFKGYNDRYGHPAGDHALQRIADALMERFRRADDHVFRLGGEEFGVITHARDAAEGKASGESARALIEALAIPAEDAPGGVLTASAGVALFRADHGMDAAAAYADVDRALYRAKYGGRNRVESIQFPPSP